MEGPFCASSLPVFLPAVQWPAPAGFHSRPQIRDRRKNCQGYSLLGFSKKLQAAFFSRSGTQMRRRVRGKKLQGRAVGGPPQNPTEPRFGHPPFFRSTPHGAAASRLHGRFYNSCPMCSPKNVNVYLQCFCHGVASFQFFHNGNRIAF